MNILGERFYFKKKPSLKTLIGVIIGMIGILIIFNDEILNFSFNNDTHIGLLLASTCHCLCLHWQYGSSKKFE